MLCQASLCTLHVPQLQLWSNAVKQHISLNSSCENSYSKGYIEVNFALDFHTIVNYLVN